MVKQFLGGTMIGPIGMSEEKDEATMAQEQALVDAGHHAGGVEDVEGIVPQMKATPGMPERQAVARRQERVRHILHTLPEAAQQAILESFEETGGTHAAPAYPEHSFRDDDTQVIPAYPGHGYDESARHRS
ncbi:Methionine ABC transporter ATP-binding protein [Rhodococcus aetherivorans]|nr:Methionine ABC transporter ATP-binding protein [Rhodococcus aetherivorans]